MDYTLVKVYEVKVRLPEAVQAKLLQRASAKQSTLEQEILAVLEQDRQDCEALHAMLRGALDDFLKVRGVKAEAALKRRGCIKPRKEAEQGL